MAKRRKPKMSPEQELCRVWWRLETDGRVSFGVGFHPVVGSHWTYNEEQRIAQLSKEFMTVLAAPLARWMDTEAGVSVNLSTAQFTWAGEAN